MNARRALVLTLCTLLLLLPAALLRAAGRPVLVCYGDSITAGYGLSSRDQAFPAELGRQLDRLGYHYEVLNRGTSGATTKDAVAGLGSILLLHPAVAVVEFGGNDGLRGVPLDQTRRNLDTVLTAFEKAGVRTLLAGITLPPNYGPDYIRQFDQVFAELARRHRTAFVPMIYRDLVREPGTIQPDGIHPTARGARIIAGTLLPALRPLLRR